MGGLFQPEGCNVTGVLSERAQVTDLFHCGVTQLSGDGIGRNGTGDGCTRGRPREPDQGLKRYVFDIRWARDAQFWCFRRGL
jgi:hypothetical protein